MSETMSCIAMTVRADREEIVIDTDQGRICIALHPVGHKRVKAIIRAPRVIPIHREPIKETVNADIQQG